MLFHLFLIITALLQPWTQWKMQQSFSLHLQTYLLSSLIFQSCPLMVHFKKKKKKKKKRQQLIQTYSIKVNTSIFENGICNRQTCDHDNMCKYTFHFSQKLHTTSRNKWEIVGIVVTVLSQSISLFWKEKKITPNARDLGQDSLHIAKMQTCTPVSALLGTTK